MNVLYIVNMNENNKKGLFNATHERIKRLKKHEEFDKNEVYSIQIYDSFVIKSIKRIIGKKPINKGSESFKHEDMYYKKIYIKRGIISSILSRINLDIFMLYSVIWKYRKEISQYDLLSVHWGYPNGLIALWIKKIFKIPYIITFHGSDIHTIPYKNKHIRRQILKVMSDAYTNIFVSNNLYIDAKKLGYKDENYIISYNGVDIDKFYLMSDKEINNIKKLNELDGAIIGFVGSLNYVKRADKFIDIFKEIESKYNKKITFLVIGDGPYMEQLKSSSNNLNIVFMGNVETNKIVEYMNIMDIMILPSRNEGLPCVILEANACGTLVVASDNGGISEAIGDSELLVSEGKQFEARFANKVLCKLEEGYNQEKLIKKVKNNFNWDLIIEDEVNLYKHIYN